MDTYLLANIADAVREGSWVTAQVNSTRKIQHPKASYRPGERHQGEQLAVKDWPRLRQEWREREQRRLESLGELPEDWIDVFGGEVVANGD